MPDEIEGTPSVETPEGDVSPPEAEIKEPPPEEKPLTREEITQLVADEGKKSYDKGWRESQSTHDKRVAGVERRATAAEQSLQRMRGIIQQDPEAAEKFRQAELEAQNTQYRQRETEEAQMEQYRQTYQGFHNNMTQFITESGIDSEKIDWGDESEPLLQKQQRILSQVGKIQKENVKAAGEKQGQAFKDMEAKLRKDLGLDEVDTSSPSATVEKKFAQIEQDYADGKTTTVEYEEAMKKRSKR